MRRARGRFGLSRRRLRANLAACGAQVLLVIRVLGQTVVERMADLKTIDADIVDALDSLVDALAIENPAAQFLDADAEQIGVLALDLAPSGFVLGKIRIFVGFSGQVVEAAVFVLL